MALVDQGPVPATPVLLVQRHQLAGRDPRRPPRLGEQHQGQQPGDLGYVGQQLAEHPAQPDRLAGELLPDRCLARGGG